VVSGADLLLAAVAGHLVADDEAATDRVVGALLQQLALRVVGREAHAVGMEGQALAAEEHQVLGLVEGDFVLVQQAQL